MTALVSIVSRYGLNIDACHKNQPNKRKLALQSHYFHLPVDIYIPYTDVVRIWTHLNVELAWATDKSLQVICNLKQLYTVPGF